jgi:deoxyribose-phosphate aldolase
MSQRTLASTIDHTLLRPDATYAELDTLCDEARTFGFASVCVHGAHVRRCRARLASSQVAVCAVAGFPLGENASAVKVKEAALARADGARELDVVLALGALKSGDFAYVQRELAEVVRAFEGGVVKVILETGLLDEALKVTAARLAEQSGAQFVKTSTGFGPRGASVEDVRLLRASVGAHMQVKASGGIRTAAFARELLAAGASRLGASASVAIVAEDAQSPPT